jgi:hypothetical protein
MLYSWVKYTQKEVHFRAINYEWIWSLRSVISPFEYDESVIGDENKKLNIFYRLLKN